MAKKPADRYGSAAELAAAANDALTQRDRDQAADILQRSQQATMPGIAGVLATPPGAVTPSPYPTPPPPTPPAFPAAASASAGQWSTAPTGRAEAQIRDVDSAGRRGGGVRSGDRRLRRLVGAQVRRFERG